MVQIFKLQLILGTKRLFFQTKEGVKPYNLLHLNALYNLLSHTYEDAIVYKAKEAGENVNGTTLVP